jgi:AraC-like DNA-binding protein
MSDVGCSSTIATSRVRRLEQNGRRDRSYPVTSMSSPLPRGAIVPISRSSQASTANDDRWRRFDIRRANGLSLSALASLCGYADQARLSREARRLSGLTPGRGRQATRSAAVTVLFRTLRPPTLLSPSPPRESTGSRAPAAPLASPRRRSPPSRPRATPPCHPPPTSLGRSPAASGTARL